MADNRGFALLKEQHSNTFLYHFVICVCQAGTLLQTVSGINHYGIQAVFVLSHRHIPAINFWITPVPHLMKNNGLNKGLGIVCFWKNPTVEEKHITLVLTIIFYLALFHGIQFFFCKDV